MPTADLGRMVQVTQQGQSGGNSVAEKRVDLVYNANGQFDSLTRYADLAATELVATTAYSFDDASRLISLSHDQGSTALADYTWIYDASGRLTSMSSPDGTTDYSYDNTGQLTGADHSSATDESYSYDANGNRTMSGYTTGDNNRLTSDGTFNYTYDAEGNRTRKTDIASGDYVAYTWDHRNRLTAVTFNTSEDVMTKQVLYTYDVFNRLIGKAVDDDGNSAIDRSYSYVYDSAGKLDPVVGVPLDDVVLVFVDEDGDGSEPSALGSRLLHGPAIDQVFASESAVGDVLWSLTDHQGTVRDWVAYDSGTDETSIINHLKYDSFGQITAIEDANGDPASLASPLSAFLPSYTGRIYDADVDLYYYRARWYDAATGRFISEDPKGFGAGDTNINRYVENNATTGADPSGLSSLSTPQGQLALAEALGGSIGAGSTIATATTTVAPTAAYTAAMTTAAPVVTQVTVSSSSTLISQYVAAASLRIAPAAPLAMPQINRLIAAANAQFPRLANIAPQWHHIWSRYLGPPPPQFTALYGGNTLVRIPAAYHQLMTNAIRIQFPYGTGPFNQSTVFAFLQNLYTTQLPINGFPMR